MRGIAMAAADNTSGLAGAVSVLTARGCWILGNDGSITRTHIGGMVFVTGSGVAVEIT